MPNLDNFPGIFLFLFSIFLSCLGLPENTNKKEPGASDMIFQINKNTGSVKRYWLAGGCPEIFERDIYSTPKSLQDMNYKQELLRYAYLYIYI